MTDATITPGEALKALREHRHKRDRITHALALANRLASRLRARLDHDDVAADLPLITIESLIVELEALGEYYGF